MLFTELGTKVLLNIYEYLDLVDSISLAGTCVRMRDVAQVHYRRYKIFNLYNFLKDRDQADRHNRIDAKTVVKCIGPFISTLVADLDEDEIGTDLGASIRKYCRNVKSLKIVDRDWDSNPYTTYAEWLKNLKLEKITIPVKDTFLMDLSDKTTLEEFHIYSGHCDHYLPKGLMDFIERNCNISSLSVPNLWYFDWKIFAKLKSLKYLGLTTGIRLLQLIADNLQMKDLEKVDIKFYSIGSESIDDLNILLKKLAENAPLLKDLSIEIDNNHHNEDDDDDVLDKCPLPLNLFNLTSLRLDIMCPSLYKILPKMQPNLKHLDLVIYDFDDDVSMDFTQQIISLIKNFEKLEIFHIKLYDEVPVVSEEFRNELVIRQIFTVCSTNRPTLRLYIKYDNDDFDILGLKLDFKEHKSTVTDIPFKRNYFSDSVEHQLLLPCCY